MTDGAHDAAEVRIPFVPDTEKVDQFLAELPGKFKGALAPVLDELLERLKGGRTAVADQSAAPVTAISTRERSMPEGVPLDVAQSFGDAVREFRQLGQGVQARAGSQSEDQWRREMLDTLRSINDRLEAIQGQLGGGR